MTSTCANPAASVSRGLITAMLAAFAACICVGCVSSTPDPDGPRFAVISSAEPSESLVAEPSFPPSEAQFSPWSVAATGSLTVTIEPDPADSSGSSLIETITAADGKILKKAFLTFSDSGEAMLSLREEDNPAEKVEVVFDPPLVVLPRELKPGDNGAFEQKVRMVVHPRGDRSRTRAQGNVKQRIAFASTDTVSAPTALPSGGKGAGSNTAHKIVSTFDADLGPTKVHNVTEQWFTPDWILLAERRTEQTRVLGVVIRDNTDERVRATPLKK